MFVLKQFLKALLLPPMPWLIMLLAVLIFWRRTWTRRLLLIAILLICRFAQRSGELCAALSTGIALSAAHRSD